MSSALDARGRRRCHRGNWVGKPLPPPSSCDRPVMSTNGIDDAALLRWQWIVHAVTEREHAPCLTQSQLPRVPASRRANALSMSPCARRRARPSSSTFSTWRVSVCRDPSWSTHWMGGCASTASSSSVSVPRRASGRSHRPRCQTCSRRRWRSVFHRYQCSCERNCCGYCNGVRLARQRMPAR